MQSSTAERRAQLVCSRAVGTFAAGTGEGGAEGGREAQCSTAWFTRSSWHWHGHLWPEVPSRSRTAALCAPEQSSGLARSAALEEVREAPPNSHRLTVYAPSLYLQGTA